MYTVGFEVSHQDKLTVSILSKVGDGHVLVGNDWMCVQQKFRFHPIICHKVQHKKYIISTSITPLQLCVQWTKRRIPFVL